MKFGLQLKVPVPLALSTKVAPVGKPAADSEGIVASGSLAETLKFRLTFSVVDRESDGIVSSGSVADIVKLRFIFSVVLLGPIVARIGAWLPDSETVISTISLSIKTPSEAVNVTL